MASESNVKKSVCEFSSKLYQHVIEPQENSPVNTFVSPLSVYATMAMTLSGSDGNTKTEMLSALQMPSQLGSAGAHQTIGSTLAGYFKSTKGVTLNLANGMFASDKETIKEPFKTGLKLHYGAYVENLPFSTNADSSRERINEWVTEETKQKIKELLAPGSLKEDTVLVLANALYFRGSWSKQFPKENTMDKDFHKLDGSKMRVKMMFVCVEIASAELPDLEATVFRLPFLESNWEMVVVLPNANDGLKQLMKKMCDPNLLAKILTTQCEVTETELSLPRFKLGEGEALDMIELLEKMGMKDLFAQGRANLTGICDSKNLFVSAVRHKAILEVDEEGATAAAATAGLAMGISAQMYPEICVDHPFFVALVCDKTIPVFVGHVTEPESF